MPRHLTRASGIRVAIALLLLLSVTVPTGWSLIAGSSAVLADDDDDAWEDDWDEDDRDDDDDDEDRRDNGGRGKGDNGRNSGRGHHDDDDVHVRTGGGTKAHDGEALILHPAASPTPRKTPIVETSAQTTGSLRIFAFRCIDRPAGNDWEKHCTTRDGEAWFALEPKRHADEMTPERRLRTDAIGEVSVDSLPAGRYELDRVDGDWCYAEATSVDDDGYVIIVPSETTEVWVYTCGLAPK